MANLLRQIKFECLAEVVPVPQLEIDDPFAVYINEKDFPDIKVNENTAVCVRVSKHPKRVFRVKRASCVAKGTMAFSRVQLKFMQIQRRHPLIFDVWELEKNKDSNTEPWIKVLVYPTSNQFPCTDISTEGLVEGINRKLHGQRIAPDLAFSLDHKDKTFEIHVEPSRPDDDANSPTSRCFAQNQTIAYITFKYANKELTDEFEKKK